MALEQVAVAVVFWFDVKAYVPEAVVFRPCAWAYSPLATLPDPWFREWVMVSEPVTWPRGST